MADRAVMILGDRTNDAILTYVGPPGMSEAEMTDEVIKLANGMKRLIEEENGHFPEN